MVKGEAHADWLATHLSFGVHFAPAAAIPVLPFLKDILVALGGYQAPITETGLQGRRGCLGLAIGVFNMLPA